MPQRVHDFRWVPPAIAIVLAVANYFTQTYPRAVPWLFVAVVLLFFWAYAPRPWQVHLRNPFLIDRAGGDAVAQTAAPSPASTFPVGDLEIEPLVAKGFYVAVKNGLPEGTVTAQVEVAPNSHHLVKNLRRLVYDPTWEGQANSRRTLLRGERQHVVIASFDAIPPRRLVLWALSTEPEIGTTAWPYETAILESDTSTRIWITLRLFYAAPRDGRTFEKVFSIGTSGIRQEERLLG